MIAHLHVARPHVLFKSSRWRRTRTSRWTSSCHFENRPNSAEKAHELCPPRTRACITCWVVCCTCSWTLVLRGASISKAKLHLKKNLGRIWQISLESLL